MSAAPSLDIRALDRARISKKSTQQSALSIQPARSFARQKSFLGMDRVKWLNADR